MGSFVVNSIISLYQFLHLIFFDMDNDMAGLLMLAKIANVQFADKPDGWDTLVFEVDKFDRRLNRSIPTVQTALIPNDAKGYVKEFRAAEGNLAIVPLELRSSKNGGAYLIVTGGIVDAATLLTA